jgi:hypothetical protein
MNPSRDLVTRSVCALLAVRRTRLGRAGLLLLLALGLTAAQAQTLRDPTVAPAAAGLTPVDASHPDSAKSTGMALLIRDGVPHLLQGTRLYTVGQSLGQARIERITETEVWLREAGQLQKIPLNGGVRRRPAAAPVAPGKPTVAPVTLRRASSPP